MNADQKKTRQEEVLRCRMAMWPLRWKDAAADEPMIRDYPASETTAYMITGIHTRTIQYIAAKTLSQMDFA
jgi:hypothetical protein